MSTTMRGRGLRAASAANRRTRLTPGAAPFSLGVGMARTLNAVKPVVFFAFAAPIRTR
jgi:hypothetical protein